MTLLELAFDQEVQYLRLARRQGPEPDFEIGHFRFMIAHGDRATRRLPHALQERRRVKGLLDEVRHSLLHGRYGHWNVAVARDHDRGRGGPDCDKVAVEGEPIHPRQTNVRQKAD